MKAARAGHLCTVQFLISKGANVNRSTTNNEHTVLSLACAGGHLGVVELLLEHGAGPMHKLKGRWQKYRLSELNDSPVRSEPSYLSDVGHHFTLHLS